MPVIRFDTIEGALSEEIKQQLADALTQAAVKVIGEKIKPNTWVVINEAPQGNFYIGGHALSPKVYHKIMAEK